MKAHHFGLIGYGHWGKNLARVAATHPAITLKTIADASEKSRAAARAAHPDVACVPDAEAVIADPDISAVIITSPASTHFSLARRAMEADKHVLVTKPAAETAGEVRQLLAMAEKYGRTVVVDHTFLYHPCVMRIKEILGENWLGAPLTFDTVRTGLGIYKKDVEIIADLAVHDLAILDHLFGPPQSVAAISYAAIADQRHDNVSITMYYASGLHAHLRASWLSPLKQRLAVLVGANQMLVWDDGAPTERLKAFDAGVERLDAAEAPGRAPIGYRNGPSRPLATADIEPLRAEVDDFLGCMESGRRPISSLDKAFRVMAVVEACQESASRHGGRVTVSIGGPAMS